MIFTSEMHYFLMQQKFLWIESIFDKTYSVLQFFNSSNFLSLCKIYKIQIYTSLTSLLVQIKQITLFFIINYY